MHVLLFNEGDERISKIFSVISICNISLYTAYVSVFKGFKLVTINEKLQKYG